MNCSILTVIFIGFSIFSEASLESSRERLKRRGWWRTDDGILGHARGSKSWKLERQSLITNELLHIFFLSYPILYRPTPGTLRASSCHPPPRSDGGCTRMPPTLSWARVRCRARGRRWRRPGPRRTRRTATWRCDCPCRATQRRSFLHAEMDKIDHYKAPAGLNMFFLTLAKSKCGS